MKSNYKKFTFLFLTLILIFFLLGCAPISSQEDAENFTNAMIKGFMIGDTDVSRLSSKDGLYKSSTISTNTINPQDLQTKFTGSHFANDISNDFDGITYNYNSTKLIYDNETYIVSGSVHWALNIDPNSTGFKGIFIAYGNLQVSKNGQKQDVVIFDAKYDANFTLNLKTVDPDGNYIYTINFLGSFISYVNDFVVNKNSWSITFEGQLFIS